MQPHERNRSGDETVAYLLESLPFLFGPHEVDHGPISSFVRPGIGAIGPKVR
jgi:hypothetical protein